MEMDNEYILNFMAELQNRFNIGGGKLLEAPEWEIQLYSDVMKVSPEKFLEIIKRSLDLNIQRGRPGNSIKRYENFATSSTNFSKVCVAKGEKVEDFERVFVKKYRRVRFFYYIRKKK